MNSGEERDITTTTPAASQPDESNRAPSGTLDSIEAGSDNAEYGAQSVEGAGEENRTGEIGGRAGPDPVRYGDWEKKGRCIDF